METINVLLKKCGAVGLTRRFAAVKDGWCFQASGLHQEERYLRGCRAGLRPQQHVPWGRQRQEQGHPRSGARCSPWGIAEEPAPPAAGLDISLPQRRAPPGGALRSRCA